jgi:hypothetical protein
MHGGSKEMNRERVNKVAILQSLLFSRPIKIVTGNYSKSAATFSFPAVMSADWALENVFINDY